MVEPIRYNPDRHNRRSIRLRGYDYTRAGAYFITICTHNRASLFGNIHNGAMYLNDWGRIVADAWIAIPDHFPHATPDAFVVMPNHVHGIVWLRTAGDDASVLTDDGRGEACLAPTDATSNQKSGFKTHSVASIVASFKSAATKRINELRGTRGMKVWQRNFYEHIIRDDSALHGIRRYIRDNPIQWSADDLFVPR